MLLRVGTIGFIFKYGKMDPNSKYAKWAEGSTWAQESVPFSTKVKASEVLVREGDRVYIKVPPCHDVSLYPVPDMMLNVRA